VTAQIANLGDNEYFVVEMMCPTLSFLVFQNKTKHLQFETKVTRAKYFLLVD